MGGGVEEGSLRISRAAVKSVPRKEAVSSIAAGFRVEGIVLSISDESQDVSCAACVVGQGTRTCNSYSAAFSDVMPGFRDIGTAQYFPWQKRGRGADHRRHFSHTGACGK